MAIIHKLVESGAEDYLPFLLARERVIRKQREDNPDGSMSGGYSIKYELGDVSAELRMVGNQSFVQLTMAKSEIGGGKTWVAFAFEPDFQFSDSNNVPIFNGPKTGTRPTPPQPPVTPFPEPPKWDNSKFRYKYGDASEPGFAPIPPEPPSVQEVENDPGFSEQQRLARDQLIDSFGRAEYGELRSFVGQGFSRTGSENGEWYRLMEGVKRSFTGLISPPVYVDGQLVLPAQPYYKATYRYDSGDDAFLDYIKWVTTDGAAYRDAFLAANAAGAAAQAAYTQVLIQWSNTVLAEWESQNIPGIACPPYFKDLLPEQRAGRAPQIAALYAEMRKGMGSLCIASRVLHPQYIPKEEPAEPIATDAAEWVEPGKYVGRFESVTTEYTTAIYPACNGARMRANTYVGGYPYAPGGQNNPYISLSQGFGYTVRGTLYDKDKAVPNGAVELMDQYQDWLESPRRPAQNSVSFDLVYGGTPGEICIALFEFYAYDHMTDQWMWAPSVSLLESSPLNSCYSICYGYPDHERDAKYTNRPLDGSVTQMRSYAFLKHTKTPAGWGPAVTINAPQITLDVTAFSRNSLPPVWCAVKGVQDWMLPAMPNPHTAVDKTFMASSNPPDPSQAGTTTEVLEWIHAQCLSRFQIPFK